MVIVTRRRAVFAFVILLAAGAVVAADEPDIHQEATEAAEAWLELIDAGKYDDSWDTAANYFKSSVRQEKWREMAAAVRGPLGRVLSREVKATEYRTELPGAPDGEYVVIQFATSFENKKTAVETVTPMRDGDGAWRVSGYFIR
jgi:predicted SnoaL-like aldol condensation-catalyzing enzyme